MVHLAGSGNGVVTVEILVAPWFTKCSQTVALCTKWGIVSDVPYNSEQQRVGIVIAETSDRTAPRQ